MTHSVLEVLVSCLRGIGEIPGANPSSPSPKVHGYQRMAPITSGAASYESTSVRVGHRFFSTWRIKTGTTRVAAYHCIRARCRGTVDS